MRKYRVKFDIWDENGEHINACKKITASNPQDAVAKLFDHYTFSEIGNVRVSEDETVITKGRRQWQAYLKNLNERIEKRQYRKKIWNSYSDLERIEQVKRLIYSRMISNYTNQER